MSDIQPWYKQFWPWFLIILPLCAVVASINLLLIALDTSDSLVAEEYYKEGKAINQDLRKINHAKKIGMQYLAKIDGSMIEITQHGGPAYTAALNINFYHRTLKALDIDLKVTADGSGIYRIPLDESIRGPWEIRIEGFDAEWRIQQRIDITDNVEYWLN
ncbi:FixH family protein [Shewanella sp. OMA3-2]|uniref:FixH family protein n=1 Tax=Shewanella sp. OMA3-2 TaxID=2908650 RepID=UPI001F39A2FD|nr:FixH family protein [Shewanella sp. OMA3-2]UJF20720.1 FixH family protein [Shewanella sp. OMA3-2]